MQIAMETFFLPEFPDFCRKKLWQKVLCNGAQMSPSILLYQYQYDKKASIEMISNELDI